MRRWEILSNLRIRELKEEADRLLSMNAYDVMSINDLSSYIVSRINLENVLKTPLYPIDFAVDFDAECDDMSILKANATGWYGIRSIDTGFDSCNLCIVTDYFGGGCGQYIEIFDGEDVECAKREISRAIVRAMVFNGDSVDVDTKIFVDYKKKGAR